MEVRMSLADASALLKVAPNTIRSRFKAGKIRGERDNTGKIWVWIDPDLSSSKLRTSKPSNEASNDMAISALTNQLNRALDELDKLHPKAALVDQLTAEKSLLIDQINDLKSDREAWRALANRRGFLGLFRR